MKTLYQFLTDAYDFKIKIVNGVRTSREGKYSRLTPKRIAAAKKKRVAAIRFKKKNELAAKSRPW